MMDAISLHHNALDVVRGRALALDGAIHVHGQRGRKRHLHWTTVCVTLNGAALSGLRVFAAPVGDVAALDDDIVPVLDEDAVLLRVPQRESANDDVVRLHHDAVLERIGFLPARGIRINGGAVRMRFVEHKAARRPAFRDA